MQQTLDTFGSKSSFSLRGRNWLNAIKRTRKELNEDNLGMISAGVAFFVFLGVFPLLAAFISLYGMFSSPEDIVSAMQSFEGVIPADIVKIMESQLSRLVGSAGMASKAALISFAAALWSGSKAIKGMMNALSVVNGKKDERHFMVKSLVALALTLGALLLGAICIFFLAVAPAAIAFLKLEGLTVNLFGIGRWALLGVTVATGLAVLYRFGPDRRGQKWRWLTPGSLIATVVWLVASGLFSWFVGNFGNYNKTYGSLGAIAILMLWLSLSAWVFITGAELDVELEREKRLKG